MPIWKCEATPYLHRTMPASKKSKERLKAVDEALALEDLVGSHPYEEAESMECIENIKVMIKLLGTNAKEDVTAMSVRNTEISKYLKNSVAPTLEKEALPGLYCIARTLIKMILYAVENEMELFPCYEVDETTQARVKMVHTNLTKAVYRFVRKYGECGMCM